VVVLGRHDDEAVGRVDLAAQRSISGSVGGAIAGGTGVLRKGRSQASRSTVEISRSSRDAAIEVNQRPTASPRRASRSSRRSRRSWEGSRSAP
jgi:hypothetical protein